MNMSYMLSLHIGEYSRTYYIYYNIKRHTITLILLDKCSFFFLFVDKLRTHTSWYMNDLGNAESSYTDHNAALLYCGLVDKNYLKLNSIYSIKRYI